MGRLSPKPLSSNIHPNSMLHGPAPEDHDALHMHYTLASACASLWQWMPIFSKGNN